MTASTVAQAQSSAQALSVAPAAERAGANVDDANQLEGTTIWIVGAIVLGLAIWGIIELTKDDDPSSP